MIQFHLYFVYPFIAMFQHLQTVFWILAPMFVGFAIRVPKPYLRVLAKILSLLVYVILLLIGIGLSQVNQLISQLDNILLLSLLLFGLLMACNLIALCLLDKWLPWQVQRSEKAACNCARCDKQQRHLYAACVEQDLA